MLLGLAGMHRRGVVHADVQPSNIMVGEESPRGVMIDRDTEWVQTGVRARRLAPLHAPAWAPLAYPGVMEEHAR